MQATYQEKKEIVLRVQKLDSMGRTAEVRLAMEKNDPPRMPKLGEATTAVHEMVTENCGEYPKAMYRLALKNGLPAGDIKDKDYPLPFDLAACRRAARRSHGGHRISESRRGKTSQARMGDCAAFDKGIANSASGAGLRPSA